MAVTDITTTAKKYYNPQSMYFRIYGSNGQLGDTYYKIGNVPRDTTTITQDDNEETKIENEFSNDPIVNATKLGSYTFATEIADFQPTVLTELMGFEQGTTPDDKIYAPSSYKEVFVEVTLVFQDTAGYMAAVLPKVQINAKVLIESLNSNVGRATISGVGFNTAVGDKTCPFYLDPTFELPA